jgi:hypothetical protein
MEEKFIPQKGETYWYVSVDHCCNFGDVKVMSWYYKPDGGNIDFYEKSNNYFRTEEEAKEMANKVRAIFGQPPLE